ncbi:MAG: ABC transporter permease [Alphaproteobacteria bacterium]|nr:ABC transporter permease [Alphaproteobacteria bacterium]
MKLSPRAQKPLDQKEGQPLMVNLALRAQPRVPVRRFGAVNWRGLWTLTSKEIRRFLKIPIQTIVSPLVMTMLFYAVFALGMRDVPHVGAVPFLIFVMPGLIMMNMAQSAFMNSSSSLTLSKLQDNIVDVLMAPLSPFELTLGFAIGGLVRGLMVGLVSYLALLFVGSLQVEYIFFALYFAVMGSLMLSLMGVITGIWADKFDQVGGILNFIIMPATFLSGTFFSVTSVPEGWRALCYGNPFFYMIDGFRYGFTGVPDHPVVVSMAVMMIMNLALFAITYLLFDSGIFLKK